MSGGFDADRDWRILLAKIGRELRKKNIKDIIYIEGIPAGDGERLTSGENTLKTLVTRGRIHMNQPDELIKLMKEISRCDLIQPIKEFSNDMKDNRVTKTSGKSQDTDKNIALKKPSDFTARPDKQPNELRLQKSNCGICLLIINDTFEPLESVKKHDKGPQQHCMKEVPTDSKDFEINGQMQDDSTFKEQNEARETPSEGLVDALESTFKWLGFIVVKKFNCTGEKMKDELQNVADDDHAKYDIFVCCILTHGYEDHKDTVLYGTDWKSLEWLQIRSMFKSNQCESLAEKPKIFLIQACDNIDAKILPAPVPNEELAARGIGSDVTSEDRLEAASGTEDMENARVTQERFDDILSSKRTLPGVNPQHWPARLIPSDSHFLILQWFFTDICNKEYKSDGSCFLSSVCKVLRKHAHDEHLRKMLKHASGKCKNSYPDWADTLDSRNIFFSPSCEWDAFSKERQ